MTLNALQEKPWYRFFKAVYALALGLGIILAITLLLTEEGTELALVYFLFFAIPAEISRRVIYYTLLGEVFPKE